MKRQRIEKEDSIDGKNTKRSMKQIKSYIKRDKIEKQREKKKRVHKDRKR